jgi:Tfp pilus assembly protein PilF
VATLETLINRVPAYPEAYLLLADIYEQQGKKDEAAKVCNRALEVPGMPERVRTYFTSRKETLENSGK